MAISFRSSNDDDQEFLYQVYASTREEELRVTGWSEQEKEDFLRMQFRAQHMHYHQNYCRATYDVILLNDQPIGRLYMDRGKKDIRVIDIALLTEYRGQGIGGKIMRDILAEAESEHKVVSIHVEQNNPAMRLYEKLGFRQLEEVGVYYLMEWTPTGVTSEQAGDAEIQ